MTDLRGASRKHCELFPTTLAVTKDIISELKNGLLQASAGQTSVRTFLLLIFSLETVRIRSPFGQVFDVAVQQG